MRGTVRTWLLGLGVMIGIACFLISTPTTEAAINPQINFQGKLTNTDGTNVTNGTYSIVFSLYSVASGGSAVWTETQGSVSITDGIFQVSLGSVTSLPGSVDFNSSDLYLGIKVGADAEMTPRVRLTAAPYAFNSDRLNGLTSSNFVQLSPGSQQSGFVNISGNISAGGTYNSNTFTSNSLLFGGSSAASIQSAASQNLQLDSGTSGTLSLGATNATAITLGKSTSVITVPGSISINSNTTVPTADQFVVDNTASTGVTTAGVNGINVKYKGGAAAAEASGVRIDFIPGTTSGGTWSGLRIVADATGPVSGVNAYGIKLEGPTAQGAGTETAIRIASGWDIGIDVQSGGLQLLAQSDPASPAANNLRIYAKDIAGRIMPKWIGPAGVDTPFQASLGFNRVAMAIPNGTANCGTGYTLLGLALTGGGTCTAPALATSSLRNSVRRIRYSTGTTAGTSTYQRASTPQVWRGNAAGLGGFFFTTRFSMSTTQTNNRVFVGMNDIVANPTTNVDYSTSTASNKIGVTISADTGNWRFMTNTAGTAPTVTDLGATVPVNTTDLYELVLYSAPNGSSIGYRLQNITTGAQVSGSASTNLPANNVFLSPFYYANNNATAAAVILDNAGWYLESDN